MNRERFIRQRRDDWLRFEGLLGRMKTSRLKSWSGSDIATLAQLYRSICCDLALAQSREWGLRLETYLNDLVAQGHSCLYRSPPGSFRGIGQFITHGFPRLLRRRASFFFAALGLFLIPFLVAMFLAWGDPVLAERMASREALDGVEQIYAQPMDAPVDEAFIGQRSGMHGFYINNNIGIAFRCFALGALAGIGTIYTLLFNGIFLGAITGDLIGRGYGDNFFSFAISHGSFELTAIVISGAAGLLIGWGIVHPGDRTRLDSLRHHGLEAVQLACGAGIMLALAAAIEAWFSPLPIPHWLKYLTGTVLWIVMSAWLLLGGREEPIGEN